MKALLSIRVRTILLAAACVLCPDFPAAAGQAGKTVLLDCYYNNEWRPGASGAPERYHYVWSDTTNSGFSIIGEIISESGASIDTLCREPEATSLSRASIYMIVDPDTPQETPDPHYIGPGAVEAIVRWVHDGGILLLFGNDKGNAEFGHLNALAERFGIHFNEVSRNQVQGREYATGTFDSLPPHPVFAGVRKIFLKEISTLRLTGKAGAVLADGKNIIMAAADAGKGKVFAVGDPWLYNEYMDHRRLPAEYGNAIAGRNLFRWLLGVSGCGTVQPLPVDSRVPFEMPAVRLAEFPDRTVNIMDFGAVPDGRTMNTNAFARAIAACSRAGGGTVLVPEGIWRTGPIRMESNINLHLERGALVQFSGDFNDYPVIAGFPGTSKRYIVTPPLSAYGAANIAITGDGVIDGSGEAWRYVKKEKVTVLQWNSLTASGGVVSADGKEWWPSREAMNGEAYIRRIEQSGRELTAADYAKAREFLRPDLVSFVQCTRVLLDGPTFENSPRYHIHPIQCEDLVIRNVHVLAPWYAQNADGIDLGPCRRVLVDHVTVDVGDDGICLKPGSLAATQSAGPACENIVIKDCVVYHAHGGFVVGSESYGGVRNVSVTNCTFVGTDVGLRFKSARDRGGTVEKIFIDGIRMRNIATDAILFDMYYAGGAPDVEAGKDLTARTEAPVTNLTPRFHDISIRNLVCVGAKRAIVINGLPEMPVRNIRIDSAQISADAGVFLADAEQVSMNACALLPKAGAAFTLIQSRDITFRGGMLPEGSDPLIRVTGERSENIRIGGVKKAAAKKLIDLGDHVKPGAIILE